MSNLEICGGIRKNNEHKVFPSLLLCYRSSNDDAFAGLDQSVFHYGAKLGSYG